MKKQTNIVEHAVNTLVGIAERAFTNLFGDFRLDESPKPKRKPKRTSRADASLDIPTPKKRLSADE